MDIDYLVKSNVILDHFPIHNEDRHKLLGSWKNHRMALSFGMATGVGI